MVTASGGTLLGSAAGALLPFAVARWFEVGRATDVYFIVVGAVQLVAYLLALVVEGAVLPFATKALQRDARSLRRFSRTLAVYVTCAAVPVTVAALAAVVLVLLPAAGLGAAARGDALQLVVAVAALPVLASLSGIVSAAGFALDRFAFTTGTQVLRAGGGLLAAALLGDELGLVAVAWGLTAGEAVRALVLLAVLPRSPAGTPVDTPDVGMHVLRLASPTLLASIVIAVNPIVDKTVAARLDPGAATLVELGEKLFYIPMVLLIAAVTKVSTTVWARQVDVDDVALHRDFWRTQKVSAVLTTTVVVVAVPAVLLGRDLLTGLLGLEPDSVFPLLLVVYVVGLPLALAADLAGAMLIVLRRTGAIPALAVLLVVVNLVADVVGAHLFGVLGIAASTTLVRAVNVVVFVLLCERHLRRRVSGADAAPALGRAAR